MHNEHPDIIFRFMVFYGLLSCLLLFCLFQPNIVYLIHRRWFKWRSEDEAKADPKIEVRTDLVKNETPPGSVLLTLILFALFFCAIASMISDYLNLTP